MTADVCLLLEGTYPFVPGGVSSWVHRILLGMPDRTFALVHLGPRAGCYREPAFELPPNVVSMTEGWLTRPEGRHRRAPARLVNAFAHFATAIAGGDPHGIAALADCIELLQRDPDVVDDLLLCRPTWDTLRAQYRQTAPEEPFADYFWHWLGIYRPLLHALATPVPTAGLYHAVSTGYAGMLAAVARCRTGATMLLTEHGIYTKERRIEIHAAEWIRDRDRDDVLPAAEAPFFRRQWNHQFEQLSRLCYQQADRIVTLFEGNRQAQIADGAPPERTAIISNGIDIDRYAAAADRHDRRLSRNPFTVAFAGRIAPIKDLRTFVSAMRLCAQHIPDLVVRVLGPDTDDPDYAAECRQYVEQTGLADRVHFEGSVDLSHHLGDVDVLVLTSISEAQPLVVLEAGAVGVPVVCTDVGACRELIHGSSPQDQRLGPGGILTPIASPGATANAILDLWRDPQRRRRLGESLQQRVRRHYTATAMLDHYRDLYATLLQSRLQPATTES